MQIAFMLLMLALVSIGRPELALMVLLVAAAVSIYDRRRQR
jgi:hypothetical protein